MRLDFLTYYLWKPALTLKFSPFLWHGAFIPFVLSNNRAFTLGPNLNIGIQLTKLNQISHLRTFSDSLAPIKMEYHHLVHISYCTCTCINVCAFFPMGYLKRVHVLIFWDTCSKFGIKNVNNKYLLCGITWFFWGNKMIFLSYH